QAAELQSGAEIQDHVHHPWRAAKPRKRRMVLPVESLALGRTGLGDCRTESPRVTRIRTEIHRRDFRGLGRQGDDRRSRERHRRSYAKWSPHLFVDKTRTPTLVITNELDFRVPYDQGLQLLTGLRRNGIVAEGLVFPDEGHWVLKALNSKRWHETVFDWIRRYL